MRNELQYIQNL